MQPPFGAASPDVPLRRAPAISSEGEPNEPRARQMTHIVSLLSGSGAGGDRSYQADALVTPAFPGAPPGCGDEDSRTGAPAPAWPGPSHAPSAHSAPTRERSARLQAAPPPSRGPGAAARLPSPGASGGSSAGSRSAAGPGP